jgi:hypothetical protein
MFYLFYRLFFKPILNARRLQKIGLSGKAKITAVKDTGVTINNNPQVKLILEVTNSFGQKYEAESRVLVSRLNPIAYVPGIEVPVKIDPQNEKNVVVDYSSIANAGTTTLTGKYTVNTDAVKAELEQLEKENDSVKLSGKPARAIVKKYTWMGLYVNGNNPYVQLEVEVLPEFSSSFHAVVKAVVAEASVGKFQPGNEIAVKYDYYDNTKVIIEYS